MNDPRSSASRPTYAPLVAVLATVAAGIALDRYAKLEVGWWWSLAVMAWLAWWLCWRLARERLATFALLVSLLATAGAWHHCRWSLYDSQELGLVAREAAEPVALEVVATSGPRRIPAPPPDPLRTIAMRERTRVDVTLARIRDGDAWRDVAGQTTLFVNGNLSGVQAGDRLRVFGQLRSIRRPANPGEFDFSSYSRSERRLCAVDSEFPECVDTLAAASPASIGRIVDYLRTRGESLLWRSVGPRRSGLAAAMFLGARDELEPDEMQAFLETGTIHLLVISGLNVGILAACLFFAMRIGLAPRGWALAIVAIGCVLYAVTTGAQPPVVRATVMVLVACLAMLLSRRALAFNSIAAAGLVVLALNPAELFQAGTQLSFLSVAVLAWFAQRAAARREPDPLDRLIAATRRWPERVLRRAAGAAWRAVLVSLVIWLVICPLVMARFHLVSPVAVVLGPILGLPVALAMAAGFGIFALGWLTPLIAELLGWICDANLAFMETAVNLARDWRGNHFWVSGPADWWLLGFYGALAVAVFARRFAPPPRWCFAMLAGWIAAGLALPQIWSRDTDRLQCTILSVGHGAAVVIELPGGKTLLYDAGRLGSPVAASRAVSGYLWSRGIRHVDAAIVSHADADHYNALPALLEQFTFGAIYVSPVMFAEPSAGLSALQAAIDRYGVPLAELWGGDQLRSGGAARIEVLHPPRRGILGSDNANSIVLTVEFEGRRLLLTGDLESPGLDDVMAEAPYDCDALLAPHHGSAFSDPPGFAEWSTPEWTVISGGVRDRLPEVENAYTSRGSQVLHTAECGAVSLSIAEGRLEVVSFHASAP